MLWTHTRTPSTVQDRAFLPYRPFVEPPPSRHGHVTATVTTHVPTTSRPGTRRCHYGISPSTLRAAIFYTSLQHAHACTCSAAPDPD
jgi:hypothetical protein